MEAVEGRLWEAILSVDMSSFAWGAVTWAVVVWIWERTAGEWIKSRSGELGKISARLAKLDTLAEETARLTTTTEKIRASVSTEVWMVQAAKTMKREAYVELVQGASAFVAAWADDQMAEMLAQSGVPLDSPKIREPEKALAAAHERMNRAIAVGQIAFGDRSVEVMLSHPFATPRKARDMDTARDFQRVMILEAKRELSVTESN